MRKPKMTQRKVGLFMTPSEYRAEAAFAVLKFLLARLPQSQVKLIEAEAALEAEQVGFDELTDEIECLFPEYERRAR